MCGGCSSGSQLLGPPAATWDAYWVAVARHRLYDFMLSTPVELVAALRFHLDERRLDSNRRRNVARVAALEMAGVTRILEADGVAVLHVKGLALAVQTTGDSLARGVGDIDLFIAPEDVGVAVRALEANGWRADPGVPKPGDSWAWRFTSDAFYELALHGRSRIDLHWRLDPETLGSRGFRLVLGGPGAGGSAEPAAGRPGPQSRLGPLHRPQRARRLAVDPQPRGRLPLKRRPLPLGADVRCRLEPGGAADPGGGRGHDRPSCRRPGGRTCSPL